MRFILSMLPMLTGIALPAYHHHISQTNITSPILQQESTRAINADTLKNKTGAFSFTFNHQTYDAIVVTPRTQTIRMHWQNKDNTPFKTIDAVKQTLVRQKQPVLMITNGGMFQQNNIPVGLFIAEGKEYIPLDTAHNKPGNFYMQPNGVFYIDNKGHHVTNTQAYLHKSAVEKQQVTYATQSGPMLINDDVINQQFNPLSKNINLRSGVGILANGNVVFIISKEAKTTFFDFASIFKELFGCKNALYLDGAISKMYLQQNRPEDTGGDFGAIISVTNKSK